MSSFSSSGGLNIIIKRKCYQASRTKDKDNGMCHMRISFKVDNNIHTKFHMIFNNIKLYVYQISDFVSKWINAPNVL